MSTKRRCSSLAYGEPLRRFFANWWVSQAARRASRPADGFGFAEPLRFERELRVYVRVDAGVPSRVFGDVVWGADAD